MRKGGEPRGAGWRAWSGRWCNAEREGKRKRKKREGRGWRGGNSRHEHLAPPTLFSVEAFSQLQFSADCLPQEQVALVWQTQVESERPQQVLGTAIAGGFVVGKRRVSSW